MSENKVIINMELNTKSFEEEIAQTEQKLNKMVASYEKASNMKGKFKPNEQAMANLRREIEKTNNKLIDLRAKQDNLGKTGFSGLTAQLSSIGNGVEGVIRKVTKWGLAIFGIRSAYRFVRLAVSELSAHNEQLATDIEYVRYALASTLEPIITKIVALAQKLLLYLGYIIKAWTGKNPFANANKGIEKTNAGLKSATKQAQELKKELAGFDEMNVLGDNTKASADTDTGGGVSTPSIDLSNIDNIEVPKWIQWIADHKDLVLGFFITLGTVIAGMKIASFLAGLDGVGKGIETIYNGASSLFKFIGANAQVIAGIVLIVSGLVMFISGIINYLKDPTWENFSKILIGIALIAGGIFLIFGGIPALIALIIGLVVAIGLAIYKNWDAIKETLSKVGTWIKEHVIDPVVDFFKGLWEGLKNGVKAIWDFHVGILVAVSTWIYENVISPIINFFKNLWTNLKNGVSTLWNGIKSILSTIGNWINTKIIQPISNFFNNLWTGIKNGVSGAVDKVKSLFNGVVSFFQNIISKVVNVFKTLGSKVGNAIGSAFKTAINTVLSVIETILNTPIRAINGLIGIINKLPGVNLGTIPTFNLPRLAKGGIVNNPGPGVMMGSYVAGESGPEAVIPLNDDTMNRLGESIARHMVINASITNTMNGRVISRELQKINNESDFAFNR